MVQLHKLLGHPKPLHILFYFFSHPSTQKTHTQLQKITSVSKATLTHWLHFLVQNRFLNQQNIGRNKLYSLNKEFLFIKQLKIIYNLEQLQFFIPYAQKQSLEIFLFGSAARGENNEKSDIDILIIGNTTKEKIYQQLTSPIKNLKNPLRIQLFTPIEWSKISQTDRAFYERVEKDKILLQ